MPGLAFEWDEGKRLSNIAKHGIDFIDVLPAFTDRKAIHVPDRRRDYGEDRMIVLGNAGGGIVFAAYTIRGTAIRLISARPANARERERYGQHN